MYQVGVRGLGGGGCVGALSLSLTLEASSRNQCQGRPFRASYDWGVSGVVGMVTGLQTQECKVPLMGLVRETMKLLGKESLPSSDTTPTLMVCGGVCCMAN